MNACLMVLIHSGLIFYQRKSSMRKEVKYHGAQKYAASEPTALSIKHFAFRFLLYASSSLLYAFYSPIQAQHLPAVEHVSFRKDTLTITACGAKGDGITLNTNAIDQAMEACSKKGGGTVVVPAGLFLTGPLTLKSNVNLHLLKGAVLQLSNKYDDYPLINTNWEGF